MKARRFSMRSLFTLSLLILSLLMNKSFAVQMLYGTVGDAVSPGGPSTLIIIDQATGGLQQTIGNIGYVVNGLAFDPTTGILYGSTSFQDPTASNSLITIDTTTGAGTVIGPFTPPLGAFEAIVCITFDTTGQMYGWIEPDPNIQDDLVRIDKTNASYFQYPDAGISTQRQSLDFNNADQLYLLTWGNVVLMPRIYTVDTVTGQPTFITYFNPAPLAHHGKFNPTTQQFWAISQKLGANPRNLDIFDIPSGLLVNSLPTVDNLHTIAFTVPVEPAIQLYKLLGKKRLIYQKGLYP